jgi:ribonuclease R
VDVLVRYEAMGPDHYNLSDDELSVVGARSGDTVSLGDRVLVTIDDVAILRRQTLGRRVPPEKLLNQLKEAPEFRGQRGRLEGSHRGAGAGGGGRSGGGGRPGRQARPEQHASGRPGKPNDRAARKQNTAKDRTPPSGGGRPSKVSRSDATGRGKVKSRGGRRK